MSIPFQHPFQESQFDLFDWYPKYQSCQRYFIEQAQHVPATQAVAAIINIKLPLQLGPTQGALSIVSPVGLSDTATGVPQPPSPSQSLVPYIRRLIVTGYDNPAVLHGFFGDDWPEGVGPIFEMERLNYFFAAKSETWLRVKEQYDMADGQTTPFLKPLQNVTNEEISSAEDRWSEWLAMQDWMLGPRAPESDGTDGAGRMKTEPRQA
ncbi:hypothetical protein N3K66_008396 [Trichothecium roseum]|uniref:Uncharacterized protein n=1 Tax=Trichothecium roseum TaxID=47278 RepID=A0ACC0UQ38_9HYPO|nr:hypothetical protein N3K66_008396 [Trichothecium roseum]